MAQLQQLNWSYFKAEFSGKPEEDAEEHLLRTNDWMDKTQLPRWSKGKKILLNPYGRG